MKIFGIGLSRTGTHSLTEALIILGYKATHYPKIISYANGYSHVDYQKLNEYDALTDTPISNIYKELDVRYSGSKFILTVREENKWLRSCARYFGKSLILNFRKKLLNPSRYRLRHDIYGTIRFEKKRFKEIYTRHLQDVLNYFKGREKDLLVLDICGGEGWEKLCPFLNKPIPHIDFPTLKGNKRIQEDA